MAMKSKLAVIAVGGNSLARDAQHASIEDQHDAVETTCRHIAGLVAEGWTVVISHGNGPQVGFVLRRSEIAHEVEGLHEVPIDVCGADTQGATGYLLQQTLRNELLARGIVKDVATVVTQTEVDPADPAFESPTKPIGSFMDKHRAQERREHYGWHVIEDAGRGWRRVVPSPLPKRIVEEGVISRLVADGVCVIAVGGGGIPVVGGADGSLHGVAAVIDKDYASSLLATALDADTFAICTAVDRVAINYDTTEQQWLDRMSLDEARRYLAEGTHFANGSMAPKMQACVWFLERGGARAIITNPESLRTALDGGAGTTITP